MMNIMKNENVVQSPLVTLPIWKLFINYAIPGLITFLLFGVQNIINGVVVSHYVGEYALGGVNIVMPLYSVIMVIALIVGIGSQALVSQGLGEKNLTKAQNGMSSGFWALVAVSLIGMCILWAFGDVFIRLLGADEILMPYSLAYLKGLVPFILPITLCFYNDAMLKSLGYPKTSMVIMFIAVLLNITLSLYFVIELKLGTMGTSIATGLAFTISMLISSTITFSNKREISMLKGRFDRSLLAQSSYNGLSEGVTELAAAVTILVINLTVVKMIGATGASAFTAISYIGVAGILIFLGISDGLIPVLSYNYGAKKADRVKKILYFVAVINSTIGITIFIVLQIFGKEIVHLFFDDMNGEVAQLATQGLHIYAFVFLVSGLNILITAYFTALGAAKYSLIIAALHSLVFVLIGITIFPRIFGIDGIWLTSVVAETLTVLIGLKLVSIVNRKI
jgi:putative MATE family efflux protein